MVFCIRIMKYCYLSLGSEIVNCLICGFLIIHLVKGDDSKCISTGGNCQIDSTVCTGGYLTGLCSGDANRRCCIPSDCKFMAYKGNCEFYDQCFDNLAVPNEARLYAKHYCNRLINNYRAFDEEGKNWNIGIRKCVMLKVYSKMLDVNTNVAKFDDFLLKYTRECNLISSKPGICKIIKSNINQMAITKLYEFSGDIDHFNNFWNFATEQMVEILMNCMAQYPIYSEDFDFRCKNAKLKESVENLEEKNNEIATSIQLIFKEIKKQTKNLALELASSITYICEYWAENGNCIFFKKCLEKRFPCYESGFALNEGYQFCNNLDEKQYMFDQAGDYWAQNTRECLTREMLLVYQSSEDASCQFIRATGLNALISCISGNMMCSVVDSDRNTFVISEIFQIQNNFLQSQRRNYGISFQTILTLAMRSCYGLDLLPFCFKEVNGQERKVKTEYKKLENEEGFDEDGRAPSWYNGDSNCVCAGGQCKIKNSENSNCQEGKFVKSLCGSKDKNRQCCVPDVDKDICSSYIDSTFMCREEGFSPIGYVPHYRNGTVIGKSGVTIGIGIDLGSKNEQYFEDLHLDKLIIEKFKPYFGLKKKDAVDKLNEVKLRLPILEAKRASKLIEDKYVEDIMKKYDQKIIERGNSELLKFSELTTAQRTVIVSVFYQYGKDCCPIFWNYITLQSWEDVKNELRNFTPKDPSTKCERGEIKNRRCREAEYLENDDSSGSKSEIETDLIFVNRTDWNARDALEWSAVEDNPGYVIIHHTGSGYACSADSECRIKMGNMQNQHMNENGWDDIGYNFCVGGENGYVYIGRGWNRTGAHSGSTFYNKNSIGICVMGDFTNKRPLDNVLTSVKKLISFAISDNRISSNYTLYGHKQVRPKSTECPGDVLFKIIKCWPHFASGFHPIK